MAVSTSASTVGPPPAAETVAERSASTRWRSRAGSVCSSLDSARTDVSSMPVTVPAAAARSPTATATASSSSSSSGGSALPAPRR